MTQQSSEKDFLPINGTDFVEFIVGNAKQAAYFYQTAFGFQPLAYSGLETNDQERTSYALRQGKITLVFTSSLIETSYIHQHFNKHGDGVKFIALAVDNATKSFKETTSRGARPYMDPEIMKDEHGEVCISGIYTFGETVHLFIERSKYNGVFLPGYAPWEPDYKCDNMGLLHIDHIVGNVEMGLMNQWADFYKEVMGFEQLLSFDDKDISTEYTSLMSKVMVNGNERIKFPINEPAIGKNKSQIEEFITFYKGSGVQHLAMATDDIIDTVTKLRSKGVEFLNIPMEYYNAMEQRIGSIDEDIKLLAEQGILVDRDEEGYLLQTFTMPVQDRPTLFYEIIQRKGAKSFGKGNFLALFEAIEREQDKRGTF